MNYTTFEIKGRAHTSKINSLIRKGFRPFNIECKRKCFSFNELSINEKSIIAFLDEMCYDYSIIKRVGVKHAAINLINNKSFFYGLIVSILILIISSLFVFQINIIGAENIDKQLLKEAVKNSGVGRFSFIYTIDKKAIEKNVLEIDGISSASVETKGVKLYVYIKEELPKEEIIDYTQPIPVQSLHDSIITRIIVLSGTALVENGDTVTKGQTLIAPYITDNKGVDEDNEEVKIPVKATGIVYGRVWYKQSISLNEKEIIRQRTGNYIEIAEPQYIIKSKTTPKIPYKLYEIEQKKNYYNAFFPLIVTYTRYYELEEITLIRDKDDNNYNDLISKAYIELLDEMPNDAIIIRYWSIVKKVDNITLIDVYLETEQRIDDGGKFGEDYSKDNRQS